jgi:hypothetical protein
MLDPAITIETPPPAWWRLGPGLWILSALLLVGAYLALNLPGRWFGGAAPQGYPGAAMGLAAGTGEVVEGKLVITSPDAKNAVVVVLNTAQIPTTKYGVIALDVEGIPDDADVTLFWRNDLTPTRTFMRTMMVAGGRVQDAMLAGDSNWLGRVQTVGLIFRGPLAQPLTLTSLAFQPATAATLLAARWRDWAEQEVWTGISLSRIVGGRAGMDVPLSLFAGLGAVLASGGYWAWCRWRRRRASALTVAAILMSGWLVLDMRWQWNLGLNALASLDHFAGKDLSSKRLAGIDAELEKVAIDVRPLLAQDARVFVFASAPVVAGRLAYLLLPAKIHYDMAPASLPPPSQFRTGDLMLIHRKPGVRYSPERKEFLWDNRFRLPVEILYAKHGTVLARIP